MLQLRKDKIEVAGLNGAAIKVLLHQGLIAPWDLSTCDLSTCDLSAPDLSTHALITHGDEGRSHGARAQIRPNRFNNSSTVAPSRIAFLAAASLSACSRARG